MYDEISRSIGLSEYPPDVFDTDDQFVFRDLDIGLLGLFLFGFLNHLSSSDEGWSPVKMVVPTQQLSKLVTFLRNIVVSNIQMMEASQKGEPGINFIISIGAKVLELLYDKNSEVELISGRFFIARQSQVDQLSTMFQLAMHSHHLGDKYEKLRVAQQLPFVFPFEVKYMLWRAMIMSRRQAYMTQEPVQLKIRRTHLIQDALQAMGSSQGIEDQIKNGIKVVFVDELGMYEAGVDVGGLMKEFVIELTKTLLGKDYQLFVESEDRSLEPNPSSREILGVDHLLYYKTYGIAIGLALLEDVLVEPVFSLPMLRRMLGFSNYFSHLNLMDPQLYEQLKKLLHYTGDARDFSLNFSVSKNKSGQMIDLIKDGSEIEVTNENKIKFIHYYSHYILNARTKEQSKAFLYGLKLAIPMSLLQVFTPHELQILISGDPSSKDIDLEDLKKYTEYHPSMDVLNSDAVVWFWDIMEEFQTENRAKVLRFVTNCSRPPVLGFKSLVPRFNIALLEDNIEGLPQASTCHNQLRLRRYATRAILLDKLLQAINSGTGYYLI